MMAAIWCARSGCPTVLLEKNEKLGKKLFITGKGRCNLSNACDISELFSNITSNPKFLYSALYSFTNEDALDFFHSLGLSTKVERGNRVFPASDKSSDVIRALTKECQRQKVDIRLNTPVSSLLVAEGRVSGVRLQDGRELQSDAVILATGGISYPGTGASDSGLHMAKNSGHSLAKLRPGLTGMLVRENIPKRLQGLTLKNCSISIRHPEKPGKTLFQGLGELLFTHYGVSGPLIFSASSQVGDYLEATPLMLCIDSKPGLDREKLDGRILKDFDENKNASVRNALSHRMPRSMIPVILEVSGISGSKRVNEISKEERCRLCDNLKNLPLTLTGLRDISEAIVTRGGINVKEVNASTMQSRLVENLYFAGEMLDVDALTGGFNLQIAWSTGYLAGTSAAQKATQNLEV